LVVKGGGRNTHEAKGREQERRRWRGACVVVAGVV
jgi:hypothetical protein